MSDCGVCIDMGEADGSNEFHNSKRLVARKEHRCEECGGLITKGQQYEYISGKFDGDFFTVKTCLACAEVRDTFVCGGFLYGQLWDEMRQSVYPVFTTASECFAKLSATSKMAVMDRWRKWKGLAA